MGKLTQVLDSFKIGHDAMKMTDGPAVTLYEFTPVTGTRLSKIRNLKDEFSITLQSSVRVIAPIPGRGTVGIEVPHREKTALPIDDILNSHEFLTTGETLPLAIGKTITNEVFIADLADMPHLLVAGATGQGKSVCLNVMLMSLLHKKTPDELQLVLIDPKRVELDVYSRLDKSYLAAPVVTEEADAVRVLRKLCDMMENRYNIISGAGKRNIAEYNSLGGEHRMPYVVVVIDEFGDLIMTAGKNVERYICRLAQKSRAVGIHLIISTQRPSVSIVTGNIKANFPTRIAFRTTTGTDSRVILGSVGAEKLTGNGDMLYFAGAETQRVQCAYTSIEQVAATCDEIAGSYEDYENEGMTSLRPKLVKTTHPVVARTISVAYSMAERNCSLSEKEIKGLKGTFLGNTIQTFIEVGLLVRVTGKYGKRLYVLATRDKKEIYDTLEPYVLKTGKGG